MKKYKNIKILFIVSILFFNFSYLSRASSLDGIDVDLHVGSCNNNGICEPGNEDFFVCPADCTPIVVPPTPSNNKGESGSLVMDNVFNNLTVEVSYNSAVIKWKSVIPTMSSLKWGTSPDYKDGVVRNADFLLDHRVSITNLKEGTLYYFSIQAESLLGKTNALENQIFRTLSLLDTTPPSNPTNVKASSNLSGITVSWNNPKDEDFDYVRVMKNTDRYYGSPFIGRLVYEGRGGYLVDSNVKEGQKYYYSLFSRDRAGNYSSGSLIDIVHNPKGKDTWGSDLTPAIKLEPSEDLFFVTQGSSSYDFKIGNIFYLDGDYPINIKTNHTSTIKNDDMWVTIRNDKRGIIWQYFFSKIKDKEGFINVDIPSFDSSGYYNISIYRYYNDNTHLVNQGAFQISKTPAEKNNSYKLYILLFMFFILIIILIFIISRKIIRRFLRTNDNK